LSNANAGIAYRVQQLGAEGVRNRLREINDELRAGKPVTKELKQEIRELGTQVSAQTRVVRLNEQAWLASHRTLQTSARIMSALGSVARSALAVTTAWSVASLAFGKTNSQLLETRQAIERVSAQLQDAIARGADQETVSALQDELNVLQARLKEINDQTTQETATAIVNWFSSLAIGASSMMTVLPKLALHFGTFSTVLRLLPFLITSSVVPAMLGLVGVLGRVGTAMMAFMIANPWVLIAVAAAAAAILIITHWDEIVAFFENTFVPAIRAGWDFLVPYLLTAWDTIRSGFLAFWNGLIGLVNLGGKAIVDGINFVVGAVVQAVNTIINAINSAAKFTGISIPTIGFSPIAFTAIPTIAAANGFNGRVDRPTLFLAGEKGSEIINIRPTSRGGGAGAGGGNVIVNVYGDVSGEELVDKVRMAIKDNLKQLGFTGF